MDTPFGIHYQLEGAGPTLTMVHGVGAYRQSWDGVQAQLGEGFQYLSYDLRGHGSSEKTPGPYSLDGFVDDLKQLLDHVGVEHTVLVGFSLGGLVAQFFALTYPQRVENLILISTVAGRTEEEKIKVQQRARRLTEEGALSHLAEAVDRWFTPSFVEKHPEVLEQRRQWSLQNDPKSYQAAYQVLANNDLVDRLHEISVPTFVMTGENDVGSTPRMAKLIADRVPDCVLHIFPELKHSVLLEAPDQVADQIKRFLMS